MININNLGLRFSDKELFKNINVTFLKGNCYGVIGANGAGKSTFLKLISGEIDSTAGNVAIEKGKRMAVLKQNHNAYDDYTVMETVIMGHDELYSIMKEKEAIYMKEDFSEADGYKASELEEQFENLDGWNAEYNVELLLNGLNVDKEFFEKKMSEIPNIDKIKVLLAQALFGNPDILLLDEPTNHLDFNTITWLENFLMDYENTVIVVSHDRHFLNKVCTHMFDIDRKTGKLYVGNYDFWNQSSKLALKLMKEQNRKSEEKIKELEKFIAKFSANASKSKQATSRKKTLDKINVENIEPSSRRYPFIGFEVERAIGKELLTVENVSKTVDGKLVLNNVSFKVLPGDKAAILGKDDVATRTLFDVLSGKIEPDSGEVKWGVTVTTDYLPRNNDEFFDGLTVNLIDWLRKYSKDESESFLRNFLGRMLFNNESVFKKVDVLSGGEKMRLMFSKLMLSNANCILLDQPTNHLDLESIESVNEGMSKFKGSVLFSSHDHSFINTIANQIIEITPNGALSYNYTLDQYLESEKVQEKLKEMYK